MSDMKCPFCGKDMEITMFARGREFVSCNNADCIISDWGGCSKQIIIELIRTRKALDKAKKALRELKDVIACPPDISYETCVSMYADGVLQEITALEQKDVK